MRQLLQDVSSGDITVEEVPAPQRGRASLLVGVRASVISPGTERAVMEMGKRSLAGKARARPDLVRKTIDTARAEGIAPTLAKVRSRLSEPNPLGYSLAGVVLEACEDAPASPGELVACGGAGHAVHADVVSVPRHLCARVPETVAPEDAAYATIASIALHGVRLAEVELGSVVAVVGLGVVGQLAAELVAAAGGVPVGIDLDPGRVAAAADGGFRAFADQNAADVEIRRLTAGRGADAVLVAAASSDDRVLESAIGLARDRAVVSIVGDVPVTASRAQLFEKEARVVVSRSYGPGRYDPLYEERGIDYPAGYVRWTEGRNLEEVLRLMAAGRLRPARLTTHTYPVEDGPDAYALLESSEPSLGIVLTYGDSPAAPERSLSLPRQTRRRSADRPRVGVIGAGAFARGVLLPALAEGAEVTAVVNATGVSAKAAAERFGARTAATDPAAVIDDDDIDAVVIATRHDTHAEYARRALAAGKSVFVEKPLALNADELATVEEAQAASGGVLMVGFNRRFAPHSIRVREALGGHGPLLVTYEVNAGRIPADHWTRDPEVGGGRIIGEVCHFVDLASYLCGGPPVSASAAGVSGGSEPPEENVIATLRFADGSVAAIAYGAYGDRSLAKERVEVRGERGAAVIDDFRRLHLHLDGREKKISGRRDKGHRAEIEAFLESCRTGVSPWPFEEMAAVMRATFAISGAAGPGGG